MKRIRRTAKDRKRMAAYIASMDSEFGALLKRRPSIRKAGRRKR